MALPGNQSRFYYHIMDFSPLAETVSLGIDAAMTEHKPLAPAVTLTAGQGFTGTKYPGGLTATLSVAGVLYNPAASGEDELFWEQLLTGEGAINTDEAHVYSYLLEGTTLGGVGYFGQAKMASGAYASSDQIIKVPWGVVHTDKMDRGQILRVLAAGGSSPGATVDSETDTDSHNGGVAIIHVTSLSVGATLTPKVQHSANDSSWSDLATFTAITDANWNAEGYTEDPSDSTIHILNAKGSQMQVVAPLTTVNRYLRCSWTLAGGVSPSATFFIGFARR